MELARVLRIGGKIMISVWALEQRHRKVIWLTFDIFKHVDT